MSSNKDQGRKQVRAKDLHRELEPGQSTELLKALHILTRDGDLNADSRRKLKQVNHLLRLLEPAVIDVLTRQPSPLIVDCGAGKSYLGFLLYERFLRDTPPDGVSDRGRLLAIEAKPEIVRTGRAIIEQLAYARMEFREQHIDQYEPTDRVHLVTALHACDTATDDALALAIQSKADHVAVVPCCQAEVARQLHERGSKTGAVATLYDHPWHRREFGSHLTNVIRALALEAHGYAVTITELAGWEHSLKNELILAKRVRNDSPQAREKLDALLTATNVAPKLIRTLRKETATAT